MADIRMRLDAISDELADLAMAELRDALDAAEDPDRLKVARAGEKRLTRARRAVERASALLAGEDVDR